MTGRRSRALAGKQAARKERPAEAKTTASVTPQGKTNATGVPAGEHNEKTNAWEQVRYHIDQPQKACTPSLRLKRGQVHMQMQAAHL